MFLRRVFGRRFSVMTEKEIKRKVEEFLTDNGMELNAPPTPIVEICNKIGIKVFEVSLPPDVSGLIMTQDEKFENYDSNKIIAANISDSASRKRFTIAHELAHYVLHKEANKPLYAHRDIINQVDNKNEQEANSFASIILMPEDLVRKSIKRLQSNNDPYTVTSSEMIDQIAKEYSVSRSAAQVRLMKLNII